VGAAVVVSAVGERSAGVRWSRGIDGAGCAVGECVAGVAGHAGGSECGVAIGMMLGSSRQPNCMTTARQLRFALARTSTDTDGLTQTAPRRGRLGSQAANFLKCFSLMPEETNRHAGFSPISTLICRHFP